MLHLVGIIFPVFFVLLLYAVLYDAKSLFYETFTNSFFSVLLALLPECVTRAHKPATFYYLFSDLLTVRP
jgi:hypothetical protein